MPHGVPTDEAVVAAFRAEYLLTGNAAKSARAVGIEPRTGQNLALKLVAEPQFARDCRALRDQELHESLTSRREVRRISLIRFKSKTGGIDVKRLGPGKNAPVTITDKRHEYGKLILDSEKNAISLARLDGEKSGEIPTQREIVINVKRMSDKGEPDGEAA